MRFGYLETHNPLGELKTRVYIQLGRIIIYPPKSYSDCSCSILYWTRRRVFALQFADVLRIILMSIINLSFCSDYYIIII